MLTFSTEDISIASVVISSKAYYHSSPRCHDLNCIAIVVNRQAGLIRVRLPTLTSPSSRNALNIFRNFETLLGPF